LNIIIYLRKSSKKIKKDFIGDLLGKAENKNPLRPKS
jgi:uncharacterized membrane protein